MQEAPALQEPEAFVTPALKRPAQGVGIELPDEQEQPPAEAEPAEEEAEEAPALLEVRVHHIMLPAMCLPAEQAYSVWSCAPDNQCHG